MHTFYDDGSTPEFYTNWKLQRMTSGETTSGFKLLGSSEKRVRKSVSS